jgi:hypothetical protein
MKKKNIRLPKRHVRLLGLSSSSYYLSSPRLRLCNCCCRPVMPVWASCRRRCGGSRCRHCVVVVVNGHPVLLSIFVVRVIRVVVIHNHRVVVSCTTPYVVVVSKKIINKCTKPYLLPLDLNPPCHPSPAIVCRPYPSFVDVVICT